MRRGVCGALCLADRLDDDTIRRPADKYRSFFPRRSRSVVRIWTGFADGTIWHHLWITLVEAALAFVIGSLAGIVIGFWFARGQTFAAIFDPYVKAANALPAWCLPPYSRFGSGWASGRRWRRASRWFFFIVFFNVYKGVKEVNTTVLRMPGCSA